MTEAFLGRSARMPAARFAIYPSERVRCRPVLLAPAGAVFWTYRINKSRPSTPTVRKTFVPTIHFSKLRSRSMLPIR